MEPKTTVIADDREVHADVLQHLFARPDCEVIIRRLRLGDYQIAGRLLVERKRWPDLVASIIDGRLFRQACRLAGSPLHTVVLLEGSEEDIAEFTMTREAIQGALISVSVILGIPVLRSRDAEESARLMLYASRQLRSVISGAVARPGYRPKSKLRTQLRILQGLPEVGPVRAARLLDKYGSVEAVLTAGSEDLTLVPGIGKVAAERIRWAVTEPDKAYLYTAGFTAKARRSPKLDILDESDSSAFLRRRPVVGPAVVDDILLLLGDNQSMARTVVGGQCDVPFPECPPQREPGRDGALRECRRTRDARRVSDVCGCAGRTAEQRLERDERRGLCCCRHWHALRHHRAAHPLPTEVLAPARVEAFDPHLDDRSL